MQAEFARFLVVGGISTVIGYLVYVALVFVGWNYFLSMTLAYVTGYLVNFLLARCWVFRFGRLVKTLSVELGATATVTVLGLGLNLLIVAALTNLPIALNPYLSGAIAMALVTIWNYAARKRWVYQ